MLSDKEILDVMKEGNIVIEPFDIRQLGSNSYDVRLGEYIARGDGRVEKFDCYNKQDTKDFWKIRQADKSVWLKPYETILCHTKEIIGGKNNIATKMNARSSLGRCGVSVCKCAGFGDVGYVNVWTMEVSNHLPIPIVLRVGMRIAQISFFKVGETLKQYNGKYQNSKEWKPEDMLPKLWKDWEFKEGKI